jgi:cytochrome c oxidase subunit 2
MAIFSAIVLARNDRTGSNALHVDVTAQQFAWSFKYPDNKDLATNVLRLPVHRTVRFRIRALDVIHSFWVPEFAQKQDAVPGIDTFLTVTPNKTGVYPIICTELCGLGHSVMRSTVIVMEQAAWQKWIRSATAATSGGGANAGKAVFDQNGCGSCHTLKAANATGKIGPDLDKLSEEAQRAGKPLPDFVHESIVDPTAYIEPNFPKGVMPETFSSLPQAQLTALEKFLISSSKGAK